MWFQLGYFKISLISPIEFLCNYILRLLRSLCTFICLEKWCYSCSTPYILNTYSGS